MDGVTTHEIHGQHMDLAQKVVCALTETHEPLPDLSGIWLFGSVAREKDTKLSDVDILVTHNGPEETFPFAFLNAVCEALEKARILQRPSKTRRSEKYPGAVHIITRSEELFQSPSLIPRADVTSDRAWTNITDYWKMIRGNAVKLYPDE